MSDQPSGADSRPLLHRIDSPEDLRRLPEKDLPRVCEELRDYLVEVISETGGHFAPNLGIVELTVALHYALETPVDRIVWDVGHQSYPHKVLTGRREALKRVKKYGGISGYPKIAESEYDHFGVGHASTSISAALGMATARDMRGENHSVVTVTGDGAMTGGMAFEGLNNAGGSGRDLTVILNDNRMSIAPNVGAISQYLTELVTSPAYNAFKQFGRGVFESLPGGSSAHRIARRIEASVKHFLVPGSWFEAMGFRYFGPIDGHDLPELLKVLRNLKTVKGPSLLHVITTKGKGYEIAEKKPETWHGVTPFRRETAEFLNKGSDLSWSEVFGRTMVEMVEKVPDVVGVTAAMPAGTKLSILQEAHPDRFHDVGIAEQHAVTFAAGMAQAGLRPVAAIYSTFMQRAFDQVVHDVCLQKLPVVIAMDRAGVVGSDGPTQHGTFDISFLRLIPEIVITAPKDAAELRQLLYTGLMQREHPFTLRYVRGSAGIQEMPNEPLQEIPIGTWEVLEEGATTWILAVGNMVEVALESAASLAEKGSKVGVVNCRFIKPMDEAMLTRLAGEADLLVTLEDGSLPGGFGAAVEEFVEDNISGDRAKILRLGIPDRFVPHGSIPELLDELGLTAANVEKAIAERVQKEQRAAS